MANSILTPTAVTRAIATVLHQKSKFLKRVNTQYDAQYAVEGVRKAGGSLKIRMPNQYTVRTSTTMQAQDTSEQSETLTIGNIYGMDMNFTDSDLALSLEDFTKRILEPALPALVSKIEADFISDAANAITNVVDNDAAAISFLNIMQARQKLIENLAPEDEEQLTLLLSPTHNTKLIDALKGLFVPGPQLGQQFRSGQMLPVAGVGYVAQSTHVSDLTTGTCPKTTTYVVNGSGTYPDGSTGKITLKTGSGTFKAGEKFTLSNSYAVHPETKANLGYLKQLTVTADFAGGAGDLSFSVGIGGATGLVASGARQNVSALPVEGDAVVKLCAGNGEKMNRSMYFHRDMYAVSFADLENPRKYGAWGDVQEVDGISVRIWRQGDIVNGAFPVRCDVYCGGKAIRPQLGCLIHADN